jgi:hypothetical protein
MVHIDMTDDGSRDLVSGVNLWQVASAYSKVSQSGDDMLVVKLLYGACSVEDTIMLTGRGWYGIGRKKLFALGIAPDMVGELDPMTLVGRKVWVATEVQTSFVDKRTGETRECQPRLIVDIKKLQSAGYQAESIVPEGATIPDGSEMPF